MHGMRKTLLPLVCAMLVLSIAPKLRAEEAPLAVESNRWPPFKVAIDGPFPFVKYNDPPTIKTVSLERFAKFGKLNKFIRTEKLSVARLENGYLVVRPRFRFAGPELDSRRIEVEVQALDATGQVLSKAFASCFDARIGAKRPTPPGPATLRLEPFNEPVIELQLPVGVDKSAIRVEVEFREPERP
jgi:hypothetical protein